VSEANSSGGVGGEVATPTYIFIYIIVGAVDKLITFKNSVFSMARGLSTLLITMLITFVDNFSDHRSFLSETQSYQGLRALLLDI
jgi:uncharacterized membrane protein YadS